MRTFFLLAALFTAVTAFSQNQHMRWHFGSGVGLNFSSGSPVPFAGSMIETQESCYSVSDAAGNLLFYTNGINVWDATNTLMPNGSGLLGNFSSQCMVIPKPGNADIYYIFATDAAFMNPSNGLTYSEVDMTLNGGNGDVTTTKNVLLTPNGGEWITAVPHANCVDTWVITHGDVNDPVFMAYHISATGVNVVPVTTDLGFAVELNQNVGIMKPNRTGDQIIMTRPLFSGIVDIIDFDQATGVASGVTTLFSSTTNLSYGIEFSRSGDKLYIGEFMNGQLFQYDMTAADIAATRTQIGDLSVPGEAGQLQIAPNDKIYVNYNVFPDGASFIGAINNPEVLGTGCNFVQNAVSFAPATTINGLPWYYNPGSMLTTSLDLGPDTTLCSGIELQLSAGSSTVPATYLWSDGSTDSILLVSESGTYWVQRQVGFCAAITDTIVVALDTAEIVAIPFDTSGCAPLVVELSTSGSAGVTDWSWNMGNGDFVDSQNGSYTYPDPGNYTITLTAISANNCPLQDSAVSQVEVFELPVADFSWSPSLAIAGEPVYFADQSAGSIVAWLWERENLFVSDDSAFVYIPASDARLEMVLTVTSADGCTDEVRRVIPFHEQDLLFVPNAFTPNGDGTNDRFIVVDPYEILIGIAVYNRWGELIWESEVASNGWDGTYKGENAPDGVYTWQATTALNGVTARQLEGHVTLVR